MIKNNILRLFKRFSKALAQIEEIVLKFVEDEFIKTKKLQTDNYCLFEDLINPLLKEKLNKQKLKNKIDTSSKIIKFLGKKNK